MNSTDVDGIIKAAPILEKGIDVIYIDSLHTPKHVFKEVYGWFPFLKKGGVITAQVGSKDKKPKQVENWCKVLDKSFGNVRVSGSYIPSFDCNWNFASSIMK